MPVRQDHIESPVSAQLIGALQRTISVTRWNTYLRASGFRQDLALRLYLWNAALGQSFHFPLQIAEVALRNVSNQVLCASFGPDWPTDQYCLATLGPNRLREINKAVTRLVNKYGAQPATDQIVASLTLGFWAALLHSRHHNSVWAAHANLAFPNLMPHYGLIDVSTAVNETQTLRNRIFHHEPLIGRNLSGDYGTIIRLLGWICVETRDWMKRHSSVPVVIRMRPR